MAGLSGAELAAHVASRMCQDLIGPLGAISNGVELVALEGRATGPELSLIAEAAAQASAQVRFLRVAFGVATPDQRLGSGEVRQVLADVTARGRVSIDWAVQGDRARAEVRLAFLAVMCLEAAMPRGGGILIEEAGGRWTVTAGGARMRPEAGPFPWLGAPEGPEAAPGGIRPATVQFALLHRGAAALGRRVTAEVTEAEGRIAF
jgi:histidine phosphotransferase ChpT